MSFCSFLPFPAFFFFFFRRVSRSLAERREFSHPTKKKLLPGIILPVLAGSFLPLSCLVRRHATCPSKSLDSPLYALVIYRDSAGAPRAASAIGADPSRRFDVQCHETLSFFSPSFRSVRFPLTFALRRLRLARGELSWTRCVMCFSFQILLDN